MLEVATKQDAPAGVGGASVVKLLVCPYSVYSMHPTKTEEASLQIDYNALEGVFVCLFI